MRPTFEQKLHSVASPSAMQLTMKQAKMILYLQRRHALELLAQSGVCGVNAKAHGVETQSSIPEEKPPQTPRDVESAHLAEVAGTDLSVAEFALDDAGGDADKALTTLLYANEQWKAAEKAAAERKAAEEVTEAGWAAAELLAKVEQAEKEKKTAKIKEKQAAENATAKEGKVAKEARAQAVKVAKEAKAQAEKTAKEAKESKAQAAEAKAQLPLTDSHEQKKPHVGVNVAGHKTQPKTEATGTKVPLSSSSQPPTFVPPQLAVSFSRAAAATAATAPLRLLLAVACTGAAFAMGSVPSGDKAGPDSIKDDITLARKVLALMPILNTGGRPAVPSPWAPSSLELDAGLLSRYRKAITGLHPDKFNSIPNITSYDEFKAGMLYKLGAAAKATIMGQPAND
ncbi:hypothetical protein T492DRAFT_869350, partial [Pavlovales sp. CCMP2436]